MIKLTVDVQHAVDHQNKTFEASSEAYQFTRSLSRSPALRLVSGRRTGRGLVAMRASAAVHIAPGSDARSP